MFQLTRQPIIPAAGSATAPFNNIIFEQILYLLLDFILETGHSHPMPSYESESGRTHVSLHEWTELQRIAYAAGRLAPCHVERLESIQFDWSAKYVSRWLRYYQDYRALRAEKGTLKVQQQPGELDDLGGRRFWRQKQQVLWYTKHIWPERQTMLQEIKRSGDQEIVRSSDESIKGPRGQDTQRISNQ